MKIEKRGKYAGVKVHLEPEECEAFLKLHADLVKSGKPPMSSIPYTPNYFTIAAKLGSKITKLIEHEPDLLKDRTPEEVKKELENEFESAKLKLDAIHKGKDWKGVHVG